MKKTPGKCAHDWSFLSVFNTKVCFICSICGKEMKLKKEAAEEVRGIIKRETDRITKAGVEMLMRGK